MNISRLSFGILWLLASSSFSAMITIDSVTRTVTTAVTGGAADFVSTNSSGTQDIEAATTDGVDSGLASARQNTFLSGGATLNFFADEDIVVQGSRGFGFAPVNVVAESLVDVTFTIPTKVGAAAFALEGFYTIVGGEADGTPSVAWNFAAIGETTIGEAVLGGTFSSGEAISGISEPIEASGLLWPGTYNLSLAASMGNNGVGTGSYTSSGAFGAAAFQDMRLTVTPLSPVPEPSSVLLLGLSVALLLRRRR